MSTSSNLRHTTVNIRGMTCHSCEVLLERKLRAIPGITDVKVHHRTGIAKITAIADRLPSPENIEKVIRKAGYTIGDAASSRRSQTDRHKWMEIGASLLIIFAVFKVLQAFDLVGLAPSTSGALSIGGIFVIGLVAGTSSCLAITGGLLLAIAAKHNDMHRAETNWEKFRPLLHFNVGRLVSYFVLGGVVGMLGQSITLSTKMAGIMGIVIAFVMLYLALTILEIVPKGSFPIRPPKRLAHWIHDLSESDHPAAPFTLGAFTFFLPCGFTQSLQLVALASGSFMVGAMTMSTFALGTLPSLLGISAVSSLAQGRASRIFLRFSGSLVLVLAFMNLGSGLALTGISLPGMFQSGVQTGANSAPVEAAVQTVDMKITRYGYEPSSLVITAGIPVRWRIDGAGATGCTSQIVIPDLNITRSISRGMNEVDFTAARPGQLAFSCSMGMVRGSFTVLPPRS